MASAFIELNKHLVTSGMSIMSALVNLEIGKTSSLWYLKMKKYPCPSPSFNNHILYEFLFLYLAYEEMVHSSQYFQIDIWNSGEIISSPQPRTPNLIPYNWSDQYWLRIWRSAQSSTYAGCWSSTSGGQY